MNRYIWYSPLNDFWSSYRKLTWVAFEPTTTEFHSDALTDWALRSWVQLALRAKFLQLLKFHLFVQRSYFILVIAFVSRHICFKQNLIHVITLVAEWINTYGIHHCRIFEVAIEVGLSGIWRQDHWILFRCSNQLSYQAMSSTFKDKLEWDLYLYNFVFAKTIFERVGDLSVILFFLIFSKRFFFPAFLSMIIKIVSKGNKIKTCFNKSFDILITKYTLCVLLAFTV